MPEQWDEHQPPIRSNTCFVLRTAARKKPTARRSRFIGEVADGKLDQPGSVVLVR
jgi:hypothetical protein